MHNLTLYNLILDTLHAQTFPADIAIQNETPVQSIYLFKYII